MPGADAAERSGSGQADGRAQAQGVLPWKPTDRRRRMLVLRYRPHHRQSGPIPEAVIQRLAPETRELVESAHYTHKKDIAGKARVELS